MQAIVVVPTYNELGNLAVFVEKLRAAAPGAHILIVDDNSPDGTGQLADRLHHDQPANIFVLHRPEKMGLGTAYVAGFGYAIAHDYDVVVQMDADLSHDPAYVPRLLNRIQDCDVVLGSRYVRGISVVNWDLKRLLLSKLASTYIRLITGMTVADVTGGFKCWRRQTLQRIDLSRVLSNGYLFQVETTYRAFRLGCRIEEEPIIFYDRTAGKSKLDRHIIFEALFGVLRLRFQPSRRHARLPASNDGAAMHARQCM